MLANLAVIPVQVLLEEVDDLRLDVFPVERPSDGDTDLVDVQPDAVYTFNVVERQGGLHGGGAVVADGELGEVVSTRERVVELLRGDALVDVEGADEVVGIDLDDDAGSGHGGSPWEWCSLAASDC